MVRISKHLKLLTWITTPSRSPETAACPYPRTLCHSQCGFSRLRFKSSRLLPGISSSVSLSFSMSVICVTVRIASVRRSNLGLRNGANSSLRECTTLLARWTCNWLDTFRGHAAIGGDGRTLIVSNLVDGVDTYSIPPREPLRNFRHPINQNVPLLVSAIPGSSLFVVGSDDGCPRLYDQRTGHLSNVLRHGKGTFSLRKSFRLSFVKALVQVVDVCPLFTTALVPFSFVFRIFQVKVTS